jgi:2-C-methyl-D-erythritol 4-phosphate cytidylyltransferase
MGEREAPKQYLSLAGRTVIEWSLAPFLEDEHCLRVVVVLSADDRRWSSLPIAHHPKIRTTPGGAERIDSVRAGLAALAAATQDDDWVLVHDAARPCLESQDLRRLIEELWADEVGGLLATPVVDTLKRADSDNRASETVPRQSLWRALTPQMFRFGALTSALSAASAAGGATDEAQAIEAQGLKPRLVAGNPDNLKITVPGDLERAERVLGGRAR